MDEKCLCCKENQIDIIQRGLCNDCYHYARKTNTLDCYPKDKRRLIAAKYSKEVIDDYKALITDTSLTLSSVAMKHGYTRERARQVFELINGFHYTVIKNKRLLNNIENKKSVSLGKRNPIYKVNLYKDNTSSRQYKGFVVEKKVLDICNALNYAVGPYTKDNSIDLVVNGFNVEIKSAYKTCLVGKGQLTGSFPFHFSEEQKSADFVICYAAPLSKFFIIPKENFPSGRSIYIPEKQTMTWKQNNTTQVRKNHWYDYLERWDFLKTKKKEVTFSTEVNE